MYILLPISGRIIFCLIHLYLILPRNSQLKNRSLTSPMCTGRCGQRRTGPSRLPGHRRLHGQFRQGHRVWLEVMGSFKFVARKLCRYLIWANKQRLLTNWEVIWDNLQERNCLFGKDCMLSLMLPCF